MRKRSIWLGMLVTTIAVSDCDCTETLSASVGELHLELCDANPSCGGGCEMIDTEEAIIEFGSPDVGQVSTRTLLVINDNQPQSLTVQSFKLDDPTGDFKIVAVEKRDSAALDAEVKQHDMEKGPLRLADTQQGQLYIAYEPTAPGGTTATLTVISNSFTRAN